MPEKNEQGGVPAIIEAEVVQSHPLTQQLCTCCEPPKRLVKPSDKNVPFSFCFRKGGIVTVYERQEGGYLQTDYELRENSIVDPRTGQVVFPSAGSEAAPVQERLRSEMPEEEAGGPKPETRARVNLRDEEYY